MVENHLDESVRRLYPHWFELEDCGNHDSCNKKADENSEIVFSKSKNGCIFIELNRKRKYNALTWDQIKLMHTKVKMAEKEGSVIILRGLGSKAFCSGLDVVGAISLESSDAIQLFRDEYDMNIETSKVTLPYISIWHGIVMGGGVGISIHGKFRIATESLKFCMPELLIGLIPDVAMTKIFTKFPGLSGLYVCLTGQPINAADCQKLKISTAFIPSTNISTFMEALLKVQNDEAMHGPIQNIIDKYDTDVSDYVEPVLNQELLQNIDHYFGDKDTLQDVVDHLKKDVSKGIEFANVTLDEMRKRCPLSSCVWFRHYKNLSSQKDDSTLEELFEKDYRLVRALISDDRRNFETGVKTLLIEKSASVQWNPRTIEDVTEEDIQRFFDNP